MPVAEMFGLAGDLRGSTEGRAAFFIVDQEFARMPSEIQNKIIKQIKQRKGMTV